MKKVAILQSNYIPWKGYFDLINMVDEFILYDDVQYTRRDWRNRNKIKTPNGELWLTIPVRTKGNYYQSIQETVVSNNDWVANHWRSIQFNCSKARFFDVIGPQVFEIYKKCEQEVYLSKINFLFINAICEILGINTILTWSKDYELQDGRNERLLNLCLQAGATEYLSGPAAQSYLDESLFEARGIQVRWMSYEGYPEYRQLYCLPFVHGVSILDLLFNEGPQEARKYMLSF